MKRIRLTVLAVLAAAALAPAPAGTRAAGPAPVASLEGSGLPGTIACYSCVLGAVGGSIGFPALGDLLLERCHAVCVAPM